MPILNSTDQPIIFKSHAYPETRTLVPQEFAYLKLHTQVKRKLDSALNRYFGGSRVSGTLASIPQAKGSKGPVPSQGAEGDARQSQWTPAKVELKTRGSPLQVPRGWEPQQSSIPANLRGGYQAVEGPKSKGIGDQQPEWKNLKSWTPFNPYESLNKQRTTTGNSALQKVWSGDTAGHAQQFQGSLVSKTGYVRDQGQGSGCGQDWAVHPLQCIQHVYHGHLQGTKFSSIARRKKGQESHDDLNLERKAVAGEVAEGLLSGAIRVKRHSQLAKQIEEARARIARKQKALQEAGKAASLAAADGSISQTGEETWKPAQRGKKTQDPSLPPSITPWYQKPYFAPAGSPPRDLSGANQAKGAGKPADSIQLDRRMNGIRFFERGASRGRDAAMGNKGKGLSHAEAAYAAGKKEAEQFYSGYRDAKEYDAGMQAGQKFRKLAHGNPNSFVVLPLNPKDKGKAQFIPSLMDLAVAEKNKATMERKHWQEQRKIDAFQQEVAATKERQAALQTEEKAQKSIIKQLEETVKLERHAPRFVTYVTAPAPAPQVQQARPAPRLAMSPQLAREAQTAEAVAYNEAKAKMEREKLQTDLKRLARDQAKVHS